MSPDMRHLIPSADIDENATLRRLMEGTALSTGEAFFKALAKNLAQALGVHGAWVTEYMEEQGRLRALAFWLDGGWVEEYEYDIAGTPCEPVIECQSLIHIPSEVIRLFPKDPDLPGMGAVSYMGVPLKDVDRRVLGHLAVLDDKPMPAQPRLTAIFHIFAARAATELQRMRATRQLEQQEARLSRLFRGTMDGIVELDGGWRITQANPEACRLLGGAETATLAGMDFRAFISPERSETLAGAIRELAEEGEGRPYRWLPGGFACNSLDGQSFPAEASLSKYLAKDRPYYILVIRDSRERLAAEAQIQSLAEEREYLRREVAALEEQGEILGDSPAIRSALRQVQQVAGTDAGVLLLGESGVGKELFARAIHRQSPRACRKLVKLNCAALPASLIESELFGHEKGAFTGATAKREGRFALADGGTIFLDEIGELPLELQAKLLRVLQEGEFEPLGSSETCRVDVRVVAATNRNLLKEVWDGRFRADLYYRLSVFPIPIPPLRERGDDIGKLAQAFADEYGRRMGKKLAPLSGSQQKALQAYPWPGNVRELQNVIERAVITSREGVLNLDFAMPQPGPGSGSAPEGASRIYTEAELRGLERANIIRALEACEGRIAGEQGAARLLGLKPTTLNSRIKALDIPR